MVNKYNTFIKESEQAQKEPKEKGVDFLQSIIDGKIKVEKSNNGKNKEYWIKLIKDEKDKFKQIDLLKKYLLVSSAEDVNEISKELSIGFFIKK